MTHPLLLPAQDYGTWSLRELETAQQFLLSSLSLINFYAVFRTVLRLMATSVKTTTRFWSGILLTLILINFMTCSASLDTYRSVLNLLRKFRYDQNRISVLYYNTNVILPNFVCVQYLYHGTYECFVQYALHLFLTPPSFLFISRMYFEPPFLPSKALRLGGQVVFLMTKLKG